jgi:recombination endonuclease VII
MRQERCGMWMPRKKTTCARTSGHGGPCKTAETMERNRLYNRDHPHREPPESRKKSNRKYRISSYGLTQELFDQLLEAQQNACGMCHEPFEEWQLIHVDHDHACCRGRTDRAGTASEDSCAIPATSRLATSNAEMRWLAPTWTALPSGSSTPSLQPVRPCGESAATWLDQSGGIGGTIRPGTSRP